MPIVQWAARILAILVGGMFLLLIGGEILASPLGPPARIYEWRGVVLVCITIAGMLLAWKWEGPGALVSLAALACYVFISGSHRYGVIAVLAVPGVLFLADASLRAGGRTPGPRAIP